MELPRWSTILPSYPRLTSAIFITKVFYTIAKASSIIFDLHLQIFAEAKIFELERLFFFLYYFLPYDELFLSNQVKSDSAVYTSSAIFDVPVFYFGRSSAHLLMFSWSD